MVMARERSKTTFEVCGFTDGIPHMRWVCESYASAAAKVDKYRMEFPRCDEYRITEVTETILFIRKIP